MQIKFDKQTFDWLCNEARKVDKPVHAYIKEYLKERMIESI